jgi:hypothetical protein
MVLCTISALGCPSQWQLKPVNYAALDVYLAASGFGHFTF